MPADTSPTVPPAASSLERWFRPNALVFLGLWLFVAVHFASNWTTLGLVFRDTDDMMRLVEVRDFLAGQGWFDLHQYRLDPVAERPMHWSRFVDWPMAAIVRLAGLFVAAPVAEKVAMFVWPLLTLLPAMAGVVLLATRLGGRWAFLPAVYLFTTLPQSIGQFVPGRIDHHNIQIALTLVLLGVLAGPLGRGRAIAAAATMAAMTAIGLETLPFLVIAALAFVLRLIVEENAADEVAVFGVALAAATAGVAAVTLPPSEWLVGACDALSANYVALAVVGGLGLAAVVRLSGRTVAARAIGVGIVAVAAVAAFAVPQPRCLAGPFGEIWPEVRTIWLAHVSEVSPWTTFFGNHHAAALLALAMPVLGVAAAIVLARRVEMRRAPGFWPAVAAAVVTFAIGLFQLRTLIYANALAVPLVAAAIGVLATEAVGRGRSLVVAVLVGILITHPVLPEMALEQLSPQAWIDEEKTADTTMGAAPVEASAANATTADPAESGPACYRTRAYRGLANLPAGLVAADIDLGPAILVSTHHAVVAAPYHRMQRGIVDGDAMLNRPPAEALARMAARGVTLVVDCTAAKSRAREGGLMARLRAGETIAGLEPVGGDGDVRIWRVVGAPAFTVR